ncbi:MAG: BamA/TamA family outer membrane protein [Bacteroidales bacterium]
MSKRLTRYLFSLTMALCVYTLAICQENYQVRKVSFKGNENLEKSFLLDNMTLKEVSSLQLLFTKTEPYFYSNELMDAHLKRIVSIYQSEGFIDATATLLPLKVNHKKERVNINIEIVEGSPIIVDSLSFIVKGELPSSKVDSITKSVTKRLNLLKTKRFRDQLLLKDIEIIEKTFRDLGYAYAKVEYSLNLNLKEYLTDIEYTINSGELCYIGETTIKGNNHISQKTIRKQISYKEGELYNKSILEKTRENLYALQLFKVASIMPQTNLETSKSPIPVTIYLEEAPRFSSKFGVGYGTEDRLRAFADLNFKGLLGGARRLNLYIKHSYIEPYSVNLRWIEHQFIGRNSSIVVNPFIQRKKEPGYDIRSYGVNVPINYKITSSLNSTFTYYLENVKQHVEKDDNQSINTEEEKLLYNKSGVLISAFFNNSKPQFSPTKGSYLSVGLKLNGYLFGGKFNYSRLWSEFRRYQEVGNIVLAFRALVGGIHSKDSSNFIPVEDRFYSGGSNSVRGWNRSQLGPKRESGTPLGGNSVLEANIEARVPLFWRINGVAFIDAGNVWRHSFKYNLRELAYAIGAGIRIETPIGPIRFDVGFPIRNEKKKPQFFISVGQAF